MIENRGARLVPTSNNCGGEIIYNKDASNMTFLLKCIDLTSLNATDTACDIENLCKTASNPLKIVSTGVEKPHCAAVCVYPYRVPDAQMYLAKYKTDDCIQLATVAGGFPSGMYKLESKVLEVDLAVKDGATEVDIVINRSLAKEGRWEEMYTEIKCMKSVCSGKASLKTILGIGDLEDSDLIYKSSMVAMMAGSDFIKTSTGKEKVNATVEGVTIMCQAVNDYFTRTGFKVGIKPAGGIRSVESAISYVEVIRRILGEDWLTPVLFRLGASSLLEEIINVLRLSQ